MCRNRGCRPRIRTTPIPGSVTDRGCVSPKRIVGWRPLGCLLHSRNVCLPAAFFLNRGNRTWGPRRVPLRDCGKAASARPQSTAASSNTCWQISRRHGSPIATMEATPTPSIANSRPAVDGRGQALWCAALGMAVETLTLGLVAERRIPRRAENQAVPPFVDAARRHADHLVVPQRGCTAARPLPQTLSRWARAVVTDMS